MEIIILLLFVLNAFAFTALLIVYNKSKQIYAEIKYVGSVLDLILRYAENKYNK